MKQEYLHVLNGDAVIEVFKSTRIIGEMMIWREVLCQGATLIDQTSTQFRETRTNFFADSWNFDKTIYKRDWSTRINQLQRFKGDEIVLWFEYDLFCQINMIGAINLILELVPDTRISLICAGYNPQKDQWDTLGILAPELWLTHFHNRSELTTESKQFAKNYWRIYCGKDHTVFQNLDFTNPFTYLKKATLTHFQRFPSHKDGLNIMERLILTLLGARNLNYNSIMKSLFTQCHFYGYGDAQYDYILKYLEKQGLIIQGGQWSTTPLGLSILNQNQPRWSNQKNLAYGGMTSHMANLEDFTS